MTDLNKTIHHFVQRAIGLNLVDELDEIYLRNRLLGILQLNAYDEVESAGAEVSGVGGDGGADSSGNHNTKHNADHKSNANTATAERTLLDDLDIFVDHALAQGIIEAGQSNREIFEAQIMDLTVPYPSQVNELFWSLYDEDKVEATNYFYVLSQLSDYIKTRNIARNVHYTAASKYGELEITINLSKPEKDPKEIALAKEAPASNYPKCALCMENEGYRGHLQHAARQNHRIIRMEVADETYGFQYSPYVYYNEHSIFLNEEHKPMKVDAKCFRNLLLIVQQFPHYFTGSNADLPIVGGSILAHDHYQGGHHQFPMEVAKAYEEVALVNHPEVKLELVDWPMTVLRLSGESIDALVTAATDIHETWQGYSDLDYDVAAFTGETPHNTTTPIARQRDGVYELDLVLRNNRTSEEYPDGIFHPHSDVQHIKKENIGLIEVMGLAILPPRLIEELATVEGYLTGQVDLSDVEAIHQEWATELKEEHGIVAATDVEAIVQAAVGAKFERVLEDAGVYKQTESGRQGVAKFIQTLNQER